MFQTYLSAYFNCEAALNLHRLCRFAKNIVVVAQCSNCVATAGKHTCSGFERRGHQPASLQILRLALTLSEGGKSIIFNRVCTYLLKAYRKENPLANAFHFYMLCILELEQLVV